MSPQTALSARTTAGRGLDLDAFAAAGGTLVLDGAPVASAHVASSPADGASADTPLAHATDATLHGDSVAELVLAALSGRGGGSFKGPASFRQAVERILDCDPLDVGIRTRARAASQVPVRLSRIRGGGGERERLRATIARRQLVAGDLGPSGALRLPRAAGGEPDALPLPERTHLGQRDPHGAVAHAVAMHQLHEHGELEEVTDHPLLSMLARPNPLTTTTWAQLLDAVVLQRVAGGEVFFRPVLRAARAGLGDPEVFLVEDPSTVTVVLNERGNRLAGYDVAGHGGAKPHRTTKTGRAGERPDALVHVKDIDPLCHLRGRSHLRSLWVWTAIYLMAARWNGGLIKNGAKPSGILARRDGRAVGGRQRERMQAEAESRSGPENAGKAWTDGDLVWNQISLSPREMDWETAETMAFRRCSTGVGVDPLLQGIGEHSTYNNLESAMARLYTEAALPDLVWLLGGLNEGVVPAMSGGDELVLWADPTEIPALRTNALDLAKTLSHSTWLEDGERREAQGYDFDPPRRDKQPHESSAGKTADE